MEDIIQCSFRATKESCVLTSLGYLFNYIANMRGLPAPKLETIFWTYIEYYRENHNDNGLSGKKLVGWAQDHHKKFSKTYFKDESRRIEDCYRNKFPGYAHIGESCAELLSTLMLHWVCSEENYSCNQGTGKRGYDEIFDFWDYCKTHDKYKEILADVEIIGHQTSLSNNYNLEVEKSLSNAGTIGMVLYPTLRESHSICIYRQGENYIVRDPNETKIGSINIGSITITEYIIFKIPQNIPQVAPNYTK